MLMITVIALGTGTSLFIFGMILIKYYLQENFSQKMKQVLGKFTGNRVFATLTGAFITMALQSSSASSVLTATFVDSGLISLYTAFWLIVGANTGTTFTGLLTAASFSDIAPAFCIAGIVIISISKSKQMNMTGILLTGFGLLFVGMNMMESCADGIKNLPVAMEILSLSGNAISGMLLGCFFTALIQSSSATTALLQTMAAEGLIGIRQVFYIILGANIGTCFTCAVSSIGLRGGAKKVALMHIIYNLAGSVIFAAAAEYLPLPEMAEYFAPGNIKTQTALINIIFNLACAVIALLLPVSPRKGFTFFPRRAKIKKICFSGE